jgi:hypothetical protein
VREVILICGPPCAGKTTLALHLQQPGDTLLDRDLIARAFGSRHQWRQGARMRKAAEAKMRSGLDRVARMTTGRAVVVRCLPDQRDRAALAHMLGAEVRLLDPGIDECIRRAQGDHRPPGTIASIHEWYAINRATSGKANEGAEQ